MAIVILPPKKEFDEEIEKLSSVTSTLKKQNFVGEDVTIVPSASKTTSSVKTTAPSNKTVT